MYKHYSPPLVREASDFVVQQFVVLWFSDFPIKLSVKTEGKNRVWFLISIQAQLHRIAKSSSVRSLLHAAAVGWIFHAYWPGAVSPTFMASARSFLLMSSLVGAAPVSSA